MNKVKMTLGGIVLTLLSFIAGALTSYHFMSKFIDELVIPFANVDRYALEVMEDYGTAYLLYQAQDEKALNAINARIDANLIVLDEMMSNSDNEKSADNGIKTINRVKRLREKYKYKSSDDEIQKKLESIYGKYGTGE